MNTETRVDSYPTSRDATLAKAFLESHDIAVRLENTNLDAVSFTTGPILGDTALFVDEQELERAHVLLANYNEQLHSQHAARIESVDRRTTRACIAAFLGFITIPFVVHAYSIWLLLNLDRTQISRAIRYRYALAWSGNLLAFGLLALWLALKLFQR